MRACLNDWQLISTTCTVSRTLCTHKEKENNNKIENNYAFLKDTLLKNIPMEKGRRETTLEVKLLAENFKEVVVRELKIFLTQYYVLKKKY